MKIPGIVLSIPEMAAVFVTIALKLDVFCFVSIFMFNSCFLKYKLTFFGKIVLALINSSIEEYSRQASGYFMILLEPCIMFLWVTN